MNEEFENVIIGTGLTESILSSTINSTSILQIDPNPIYGSITYSTLSLSELINWSNQNTIKPNSSFINRSIHHSNQLQTPSTSRKYHFNLIPTLLFTKSTLIKTFIQTGSSNSISFQLLNHLFYLNSNQTLISLPTSKHDLFNSNLSLIEKRKLVKLFQSILNHSNPSNSSTSTSSQPFTHPISIDHQSLHDFLQSEPHQFSNSLISELNALSISPLHPFKSSKSKSIQRIQSLLNSIGTYGLTHGAASSFLLSQYGGTGEYVESLIRSSAINKGAVQIIGRKIKSLQRLPQAWRIEIEGFENGNHLVFLAKRLIIGVDHLELLNPSRIGSAEVLYFIHRAIVVVEEESLEWEIKTFESKHTLFIIELEDQQNPIHALIVGSSSECCPDGEVIIYLSFVSEEESLNSILDEGLKKIIKADVKILLKLVYTQQVFRHAKLNQNHQDQAKEAKGDEDQAKGDEDQAKGDEDQAKEDEHQDQDRENQDENQEDQKESQGNQDENQAEDPKLIILNNWPEEIEDCGLGRLTEWNCEYVEDLLQKEF
ncbi:GDP dissociation inhibitor-domain-containing protein [Melampsora americana]|nr:GDP dissociation inhibitor-domain-containing protein [Melampsora americana]